MIHKPNPLASLFPKVRTNISSLAAACEWPEFESQIAKHLTCTKLPPHVILPIASAAAVGGEPQRALSAATACGYLIVAMRWFDDAQDRDRPESLWSEIGMGRAINMASTALTVAWSALVQDEEIPRAALRAFGKYTIALARGQDLDLLNGAPRTLSDYWHLMRGKTGAALALGCEVGALSGCPDKPSEAGNCGRFGEHLGVLMQILDDLDGMFHPDGSGDLSAGKITLPVLYGLATDHCGREELTALVRSGLMSTNKDRVLAILESIDTREFLVWCAFEERRQALECLDDLSAIKGAEAEWGREALKAFADSLMVGWESLLASCNRESELSKTREKDIACLGRAT